MKAYVQESESIATGHNHFRRVPYTARNCQGVLMSLKPKEDIGARHHILNTGPEPLKLCTLYAPPNHRDGVVQHTRADAVADTEHVDGKTAE